MQNAVQRELEFRILKVAAFHAAIANPWHSDRNAVIARICQCIVSNQSAIEGDQCQHIKVIAAVPPSPNLHLGADPQAVVPNLRTFTAPDIFFGLSHIQKAELPDHAGAS